MLWFAWKIVLLQYRKQRFQIVLQSLQVVICLKNRTFAVSQTTRRSNRLTITKLWFAWKIVLLQYRKQRFQIVLQSLQVVICLKNRTFAVSQTTRRSNRLTITKLWFAWKIVLLQYRKQQITIYITLNSSCDLLEKSYFCSIANNAVPILVSVHFVVICLKNRTFAVSQTTSAQRCRRDHGLWFAWKIVLLQYRKQHIDGSKVRTVSCDLLEKSYFCSIANN